MNKNTFKNNYYFLNKIVDEFENKKFKDRENGQYSGTVYTPLDIAKFIVQNIFKIYLNDIYKNYSSNSLELFQKGFDLNDLYTVIETYPKLKNDLKKKIANFKILDPACGSGRFLISAGIIILEIYKLFYPNSQEFKLKKFIIENMLYGVELDESAHVISKIRLILWVLSSKDNTLFISKSKLKDAKRNDLENLLNELNIKFNIYNSDFLLDFNDNQKFDFIIGNPPYIENKKILNLNYKKKIMNNFKTAYRLFDLSIVFLEKSLNLLKMKNGYLSFLMTNKFLAADYGVKIRANLLKNAEIKQIINISSLPVFIKAASYPIIISLKVGSPSKNNKIIVESYEALDKLIQNNYKDSTKIIQNDLADLPSYVFPISGNVELIRYLYKNFKQMSEIIPNLKIVYRPFGFTQWKKFFDNISENKTSDHDLLLIGTGNVGKYHIKFDKRIRIAKKDMKISYFKYSQNFEKIWDKMNSKKLIFREIAKELTVVYDPGLFTNITGLYFIKVPTYSTNDLFGLLSILNSKFINSVFKSLFGSLSMSGGYMRFNGSFIKRVPIPSFFPNILTSMGKINQFLSQLLYDQIETTFKNHQVKYYLNFFRNLNDSLVSLLYLKNCFKKDKYRNLLELLNSSQDFFPKIELKYSKSRFNLSKFETYEPVQLQKELILIKECFGLINQNMDLMRDIKQVSSLNFDFNN